MDFLGNISFLNEQKRLYRRDHNGVPPAVLLLLGNMLCRIGITVGRRYSLDTTIINNGIESIDHIISLFRSSSCPKFYKPVIFR